MGHGPRNASACRSRWEGSRRRIMFLARLLFKIRLRRRRAALYRFLSGGPLFANDEQMRAWDAVGDLEQIIFGDRLAFKPRPKIVAVEVYMPTDGSIFHQAVYVMSDGRRLSLGTLAEWAIDPERWVLRERHNR